MSTRGYRGGSLACRTRRGVALAGRVNKLGSLPGVLRLLGDGVCQGKHVCCRIPGSHLGALLLIPDCESKAYKP